MKFKLESEKETKVLEVFNIINYTEDNKVELKLIECNDEAFLSKLDIVEISKVLMNSIKELNLKSIIINMNNNTSIYISEDFEFDFICTQLKIAKDYLILKGDRVRLCKVLEADRIIYLKPPLELYSKKAILEEIETYDFEDTLNKVKKLYGRELCLEYYKYIEKKCKKIYGLEYLYKFLDFANSLLLFQDTLDSLEYKRLKENMESYLGLCSGYPAEESRIRYFLNSPFFIIDNFYRDDEFDILNCEPLTIEEIEKKLNV